MDLTILIGQKKILSRTRAHTYGSMKKLTLFSTILVMLSSVGHSDTNPQIQLRLDANANLFRQKGVAAKDLLLQQLSTETEPQVRVNLMAILSACRLQSNSVTAIEPSLNDPDPLVRSQAVITLGSIGGKRAAADLGQVLTTDTNAGVRGTAAFWLGSLKEKSAISVLGQALQQESDANIRTEIAQALKTIGTATAKSELKKGKNDSDERVRKLGNE